MIWVNKQIFKIMLVIFSVPEFIIQVLVMSQKEVALTELLMTYLSKAISLLY